MVAGVVVALAGAFISGIWLIVVGWFLRTQAEASYSHFVAQGVLERTPVLAVLEPDYHAVHPRITLESLVNGYLLHYSQRYFPVSTDWGLEGLVTVTDLQRVPRSDWQSRTVVDAMTPASRLHTVRPDDSLGRAAELMAAHDINQLPVTDEGHLLGFVTRAGIMHILQYRQEEAGADRQEDRDKASRPPQARTITQDGRQGEDKTPSLLERSSILTRTLVATVLPLVLTAALSAACSDEESGGTTAPPASSPAQSPAPTVTFAPSPTSTIEPFEGGRQPMERLDSTAPPVAIHVDVETSAHGNFDRVVFEFNEKLPGYRIEYVDPPIVRDASGEEVASLAQRSSRSVSRLRKLMTRPVTRPMKGRARSSRAHRLSWNWKTQVTSKAT
jgi:hypothetical protein